MFFSAQSDTGHVFQIKICGVRRAADAEAAIAAGADAIGLNFFPGSSRCVSEHEAAEVAAVCRGRATIVGVFVDESADAIRRRQVAIGLDLIQLHGDEPPEFAAALAPLPILRAFRVRDGDVSGVLAFVAACRSLNVSLAGVLIDAFSPAAYGGTGQVADWPAVRRLREKIPGTPIVLAGGLTATNVAEAIAAARPDAVDTASGVESSPGVKDAEKMRSLIAAARGGFAA